MFDTHNHNIRKHVNYKITSNKTFSKKWRNHEIYIYFFHLYKSKCLVEKGIMNHNLHSWRIIPFSYKPWSSAIWRRNNLRSWGLTITIVASNCLANSLLTGIILQVGPVKSGQLTIIPKPDFFGDFEGIPLQSLPFGVTNRRIKVAIFCPSINGKMAQSYFKKPGS